MSSQPPPFYHHGPERPGPVETHSQLIRTELQKATVWIGMITAVALIALLIQPILLIIGGLVIMTMLDGGTRLLGRILPIGRTWRLIIVVLAVAAFFLWAGYLTATEFAGQMAKLRAIVEAQADRLGGLAQHLGLRATQSDIKTILSEVYSSLGRVTAALGTVVGVATSLVMMLVLAIFIAAEPKLYERGVAWMLPMESRGRFYHVTERMGWTLRRLMAGRLVGMAVEGFGVWILLSLGGVPMAGLLGMLTGILAFLPNIGAIISGALIVLVGFSDGLDIGLYAVGVYLVVQTVDGYLIVPMVAKRAVDLAPALVLGAQILMGAAFGVIGLALADPVVAMIKVWLEERSRHNGATDHPGTPPTLSDRA